MKRFHRVLLVLVALCGRLIVPATAQPTGTGSEGAGAGAVTTIPGSVKNAPTPPPAELILTVVKNGADLIGNDDDPEKQSEARKNLIANANSTSPVFLNSYATALNAQLKNIIGNPSIRVRLNAAIVAA